MGLNCLESGDTIRIPIRVSRYVSQYPKTVPEQFCINLFMTSTEY